MTPITVRKCPDPFSSSSSTPFTAPTSTPTVRVIWLRVYDRELLRVRADDPAVSRCDSTARPERVAPAPWHRIGVRP